MNLPHHLRQARVATYWRTRFGRWGERSGRKRLREGSAHFGTREAAMSEDATAPPRPEVYSGDHPAFDAMIAARTGASDAAFLLPHLRPGMRLLDCGCGPGVITSGLAQAVAPGEVVGIDIRSAMIEQAR